MSKHIVLRILMVSDQPEMHRILGSRLVEMGHQVEEAYQEAYALEVARRSRLDLVIADMAMSEPEVLSLVDNLGALRPEVSVAVLADGEAGQEGLIRALGLGAVDILHRSLDEKELDEVLCREMLLRDKDLECEGRPAKSEAPPELLPGQRILEEALERVCHPHYRGLSWLDRNLEFCQAFDLVRRYRLYLLQTFFQQLGPRWKHPAWPILDRARRQADALGAEYQEWVEAQFDRALALGRSEVMPPELQGRAAAQSFLARNQQEG